MILYLYQKLNELRISHYEFFETAYVWVFMPARMPDLSNDFCQFTLHGLVPVYVTKYLKHLQSQEPKGEEFDEQGHQPQSLEAP